MIPLIIILILFCFLEEAFLPLNLVLLILVSRTFITPEKENYYLAFFAGLLLSFLAGYPLGILSMSYLIIILMISIFRKFQFTTHLLVIIPVAACALIIDGLTKSVILTSSINFWFLIFESLLIIPIYFLVLFWEERFIIRKEIRLKVKEKKG